MVTINGTAYEDAAGKTIAEWLHSSGYHSNRIAVELNGAIISRSAYADTVLHDGDRMEVVAFVGGG